MESIGDISQQSITSKKAKFKKKILNLILIGNINVGKTATMLQYTEKSFSEMKIKPTLWF